MRALKLQEGDRVVAASTAASKAARLSTGGAWQRAQTVRGCDGDWPEATLAAVLDGGGPIDATELTPTGRVGYFAGTVWAHFIGRGDALRP